MCPLKLKKKHCNIHSYTLQGMLWGYCAWKTVITSLLIWTNNIVSCIQWGFSWNATKKRIVLYVLYREYKYHESYTPTTTNIEGSYISTLEWFLTIIAKILWNELQLLQWNLIQGDNRVTLNSGTTFKILIYLRMNWTKLDVKALMECLCLQIDSVCLGHTCPPSPRNLLCSVQFQSMPFDLWVLPRFSHVTTSDLWTSNFQKCLTMPLNFLDSQKFLPGLFGWSCGSKTAFYLIWSCGDLDLWPL